MGTKHMKSVRIWLSFLLGIGQYVVYIQALVLEILARFDCLSRFLKLFC